MSFKVVAPKAALTEGCQSPRVIVLPGKIVKTRANSALDFGYPTQITVDSFFNYLYYPTQLARFYPGWNIEAREMESRKCKRPSRPLGLCGPFCSTVLYGSRP